MEDVPYHYGDHSSSRFGDFRDRDKQVSGRTLRNSEMYADEMFLAIYLV
jgi:hypothetical protein